MSRKRKTLFEELPTRARELVIDILRDEEEEARDAFDGLAMARGVRDMVPSHSLADAERRGLVAFKAGRLVATELGEAVSAYLATPVDALPREYLAVFPNYYGRGNSIEDAVKAAKNEGGSGSHYVVYLMPPGALSPRVNGIGNNIMWTWHPSVTEDNRRAEADVVLDQMPKRA